MLLVPCCFSKFSMPTSIWLPVSFFYFLPIFLFPYHFIIFPIPCLVCIFLSCSFLLHLSPDPSLIYSFISLFTFCAISLLSSLYTVVLLPLPSLDCMFWLPVPHLFSMSLCPSSCFSLPFSLLSCCIWPLILIANSLPGFLVWFSEQNFPASSVPLDVFVAPLCGAHGCGQMQGRGSCAVGLWQRPLFPMGSTWGPSWGTPRCGQ